MRLDISLSHPAFPVADLISLGILGTYVRERSIKFDRFRASAL